MTREINAAGDETIYVYDGNGNLVQKTDADGHVAEYAYEPRNLVSAINYSDGKSAAFAYNGEGELVVMDDWNGITNFGLDILGRIIEVNDHNSKVVSYTYDGAGNQTSITYPDPMPSADRNVNNNNNNNEPVNGDKPAGLRALVNALNTFKADSNNSTYSAVRDAWRNLGWSLDKLDELGGRNNGQLSNNFDAVYEYVLSHNVNTAVPPSDSEESDGADDTGAAVEELPAIVHYEYNLLNRMVKVTEPDGAVTDYTYDPVGQLIHIAYPNGWQREVIYDAAGQVIQEIDVDPANKDAKTINTEYTYDPQGNVLSKDSRGNSNGGVKELFHYT